MVPFKGVKMFSVDGNVPYEWRWKKLCCTLPWGIFLGLLPKSRIDQKWRKGRNIKKSFHGKLKSFLLKFTNPTLMIDYPRRSLTGQLFPDRKVVIMRWWGNCDWCQQVQMAIFYEKFNGHLLSWFNSSSPGLNRVGGYKKSASSVKVFGAS